MNKQLLDIVAAMRPYPRSWWVAGGWAIDLHLGSESRQHGDVDVAVLRRDQLDLQTCFRGWTLQKAVGGDLEPWRAPEELHLPVHEIHASCGTQQLEFLLNESSEEDWLFRRNAAIRMPLARASRVSVEGIPYLCPEIVLLYKAKTPRPHDIEDFSRVNANLDADARRWLSAALEVCHPGHPWVAALRAD